jgi:hypothetical protein
MEGHEGRESAVAYLSFLLNMSLDGQKNHEKGDQRRAVSGWKFEIGTAPLQR